jgi:hypothetical protein
MSTLETRTKQSVRRGSAIQVVSNPLENAVAASSNQLKFLTLSDANPITTAEIKVLISSLKACSDNQQILDMLDSEKYPYLFTSADLLQILDVTTSVKTRIAIIGMLGPRITDPRVGMDNVLSLFRFAEEKSQVEEVFKSRMQVLNGSMFTRASSLSSPGIGGGRCAGRGGRSILSPSGRSTSRPMSMPAKLSSVFAEAAIDVTASKTSLSTPTAAATEDSG